MNYRNLDKMPDYERGKGRCLLRITHQRPGSTYGYLVEDIKRLNIMSFFYWVMLGKGHGGLYKDPKKEERRRQKAKRRERSDQVY